MHQRFHLHSLGLLLLAFGPSPGHSQSPVDFNRDIRPILSNYCFACHGPDEKTRQADLRLDNEKSLKADRDGTRVVLARQPEKSELIHRVYSDDPDEQMPPADFGKRLSAAQKKILTQWIRDGAQWSTHWAYQPPRRHPVPLLDSNWPSNWIDSFIKHKLNESSLSPVPDTDKATLIRRIYLDITGLPPSLADVRVFLQDNSKQAFQKVVKRLLASEHFGERMAVYWLDLVRYADTVGYHGDQDQNISPYRDWVIRAFNSNMPFDQFTREQLAGDLVPASGPGPLIASGYNRLLQTTHEGGLQPKEYRAMYAADRVRNVSAVWMGGTLGCAQCHDHKYDPYTTNDFYSMAAFFADLDDEEHFKTGTNSLPTRRNPELKVYSPSQQQTLSKLQALKASLDEQKKRAPTPNALKELGEQQKALTEKIAAIEKSARLTMVSRSLKKPRVTRVLPRGDFLDESGPIVSPAVPGFLQDAAPRAVNRHLNRLDLANWLTDAKKPSGLLTARVFVNRMWYLFFGKGLAADLSDFGGQGRPPLHPELLDNLAISFVEGGWDVKKLIEKIVLSRTYRLDSQPNQLLLDRDPENNLFARQSRFRMPAEFIRDQALATSGLLVKKIGGDSVKPYQPAGYYRHLNFPQRKYSHHTDQRQYQRGVYIHWQRQFLHPMMKALDAPRREECVAERAKSNTPNAALALLNDPTFVESARVFAERVLAQKLSINESAAQAFQFALLRKPDSVEIDLLVSLYRQNLETYQKDVSLAEALLEVGLKKPEDSLDTASLAAWTQVARALFNLDEFVSRR
ncbi:MAG: PSD1 and planctomycete cytochrome C domain-containing protein [Planctomycetota bacterium]|nr:PSD1 and planctomycete cytochrome C domain-containing protein [Planctomycetota bacterium]